MNFNPCCLYKFFFIIVTALLITGFNYVNECSAQDSTAFSNIKIGLEYSNNFNRNDDIHEYWKPNTGLRGYCETPFYYGNANVGIRYISFRTSEQDLPDFWSIYFFVGWGVELELPLNLKWQNGFNLGHYQMDFIEETEDFGEEDRESEFGIELVTNLSYPITDEININTSLSYLRVITNKKINLMFVNAGLNYTFKTPGWLRDFLY